MASKRAFEAAQYYLCIKEELELWRATLLKKSKGKVTPYIDYLDLLIDKTEIKLEKALRKINND